MSNKLVYPFLFIISLLLLSMLKLVSIFLLSQQSRERFTTDGEWIMKHVDPRFGAGGLLIPIVSKSTARLKTSGYGTGKTNVDVNFITGKPDLVTKPDPNKTFPQSQGFAGKPYCAKYTPSNPLPFPFNSLAMDGMTGGIAQRGAALVANKLKLNSEMKAQRVPDELRPLIMAFAMIETDDLTLDQITDYMKSKTMQTGRCFGIMNVNFGHRSYLKLDSEMSNAELDGLTDKYYAGKEGKADAEKIIMREAVKVFNTSFTKIGIYCTILFHRGGPTLFNDNALGKQKEWHLQIFLDSVANTYNAIVKDMKLMTDDRRVWFNVKEI